MTKGKCGWRAVALAVGISSGCALFREAPVRQPVPLSAETSLEEMADEAVTFGGEVLVDVKQLLAERSSGDVEDFGRILADFVLAGTTKMNGGQFANWMHLYLRLSRDREREVFLALVRSPELYRREAGWQLAAARPSTEMRGTIEDLLSRALAGGGIDALLSPQLAEAVVSHDLKEHYTLMRYGLMKHGHERFAAAMAQLNSRRAAADFLDYLSLATPEQLRQIHLNSVNLFACMEILSQMQRVPPALSEKNFEILFFYAVSRNSALSALARQVLEGYLPREAQALAVALARLPVWTQSAFVEGVRRQLTPNMTAFLRQLRDTTSQLDVISDIEAVVP